MFNVIIPSTVNPFPEPHEISAARLLARYFQADISFIPRASYRTPDFKIRGIIWELKSPTGNGKRTVEHALRAALGQSENIIFDCRRTKIDQRKSRRELQALYTRSRRVSRLIMVTKMGEVVELTR